MIVGGVSMSGGRMFRLFRLLPALMLASTATTLAAPTLAAENAFEPVLEITPDDPGIDDVLMLRLSIEVPADLLVNFPRLDARLGDFAVTGQRALEPEAEATDSREWVQQYRLEPESTGDLVLPPLTIVVQDPGTLEAIEVSTGETIVAIASIVPPETDLREIRDILPPAALPAVDGGASRWVLYGAAVALMLLLAFWRRRTNQPAVEPVDPMLPPHMQALDALEKLRAEPVSDPAGTERFHIRLAAILRRYLQDGFALPAPLKTTEELLHETAIAAEPLQKARPLIEKPLGQCDLVKFARHRPSTEAMEAALDDVAAFVRRTGGLEAPDCKTGDAD